MEAARNATGFHSTANVFACYLVDLEDDVTTPSEISQAVEVMMNVGSRSKINSEISYVVCIF